MRDVKWETPPAPRRHRAKQRKWAPVAAALRGCPREWARIGDYHAQATAYSLASRIRTGYLVDFQPAGSFEAQGRAIGDGHHAVYARYVGEPQPGTEARP